MTVIDSDRYVPAESWCFHFDEYPCQRDHTNPHLRHLDGVAWWKADRPRRWHRCWAQSVADLPDGNHIERCACGGISRNLGPWFDRNDRKRRPSTTTSR